MNVRSILGKMEFHFHTFCRKNEPKFPFYRISIFVNIFKFSVSPLKTRTSFKIPIFGKLMGKFWSKFPFYLESTVLPFLSFVMKFGITSNRKCGAGRQGWNYISKLRIPHSSTSVFFKGFGQTFKKKSKIEFQNFR